MTTNNSPANLDAFRAILLDPRGVLLAHDAGTGALLRLAEIRGATRVLAACPKSRKPAEWIGATLGAHPDAKRATAIYDAAQEAECSIASIAAMDADDAKRAAQRRRNAGDGALGALAVLMAAGCDADGWAAALDGLKNATLRHLGAALRGKAKGGVMPASWADALDYARTFQAEAEAKAAERKAKAKAAAGDAGEGEGEGRETRVPDAGLPAPDESAMQAACETLGATLAALAERVAGLKLTKANRLPFDAALDQGRAALAVLQEQLARLADCEA